MEFGALAVLHHFLQIVLQQARQFIDFLADVAGEVAGFSTSFNSSVNSPTTPRNY